MCDVRVTYIVKYFQVAYQTALGGSSLTKDEQSVAEGWLGLGLESAFLCFACAEAVYTAGKKNKQRRSAKSRPFF